MTRTLLVLLAFAALAVAAPAHADPLYCVVAHDSAGNPTSTVCLPGR